MTKSLYITYIILVYNMKNSITYNERIWVNTSLSSYGKAVRIRKNYLRIILAIIAALPMGTSWLLLFIPKVRDWVIRW